MSIPLQFEILQKIGKSIENNERLCGAIERVRDGGVLEGFGNNYAIELLEHKFLYDYFNTGKLPSTEFEWEALHVYYLDHIDPKVIENNKMINSKKESDFRLGETTGEVTLMVLTDMLDWCQYYENLCGQTHDSITKWNKIIRRRIGEG